MATDIQVTIDSAEPHAQADWWAEALGWRVEPQDEAVIRRVGGGGGAGGAAARARAGRAWARGGGVGPQDEAFIRRMVEAGQADEADTTTHRGALVWAV